VVSGSRGVGEGRISVFRTQPLVAVAHPDRRASFLAPTDTEGRRLIGKSTGRKVGIGDLRSSARNETMPELNIFKGCDSETVFDGVRASVNTSEARALWGRMQQEMKLKGVDGAISYLDAEFTRITEHLRRELSRLDADG
jgi:hypothetical protein